MQGFGDTNLEMDSTVPTDLTISSHSDDGTKRRKSKNMLEDYFKERKELRKQLQLLNIDLVKKNALISGLQGELALKTDEYHERLKSVHHEKQLIQAKLQTQLKLTEEENSLKTNVMKRELSSLQSRNEELEDILEKLKKFVENLEFSEADFMHVRIHPPEKLPYLDYIRSKIKEWAWSVQKESHHLRTAVSKLQEQVPSLQKKLAVCQTELQNEKEQSTQLKESNSSLLKKLNSIQSYAEQRNYAQENFSRIQYERDRFQNEILDLKKSIDDLKADLIQAQHDKEDAKEELTRLRQDQAVLQKECENLSVQLGDAVQKWGEFKDKASSLQSELNIERLSREELLHRYANSRDKLRENFDERLELERSRIKNEINQLYEKEIRSLNESRVAAVRQREATESAMIEFRMKYEQLYAQFHETSANDSAEIKKLKKDLQETKMELSKKSEALERFKNVQEKKIYESNKTISKLQITEQEFENLKKSTSERITYLESELASSKAKLEIYQDLERELNDVISEAAQMEGLDADAVLDKVTGGATVTTNARYTFTRCVSLTRKVMELERNILSIQNELREEKIQRLKACEELSKANKLLKQVQQPYGYLIKTVNDNESLIEELKSEITELKKRVILAFRERDDILAERNQLAMDLKQSQKNREELAEIKEQINALRNRTTETTYVVPEHADTRKIQATKKKKMPAKK